MIREVTFNDLQLGDQDLLQAAAGVMGRAYNPMSGFEVGAALRVLGGEVFLGTFAESSSIGLTICAEAAAVLAANTAGIRTFESIAVVGAPAGSDGVVAVTPCGRCRQILADFAALNDNAIEVVCANRNFGQVLLASTTDLLPFAFGVSTLAPNGQTPT